MKTQNQKRTLNIIYRIQFALNQELNSLKYYINLF